jgi:murein DD-endopeptidase MepM/ murein hydrolase activator NlpD
MTNTSQTEGDSTYYSTYTTYEYDFINGDIAQRSVSVSFFSRVVNLILSIRNLLFSTIFVSWQLIVFLFCFLVYIQKKLVDSVYLLESGKDKLVSFLMWRRGLLFRPTVHGGVLGIASVALIISSLFSNKVAPKDFTRDLVLAATNTPETIIPSGRPRSDILNYKVMSGETISGIAKKFDVSVASIKWANDISDENNIKPGDTISVPPVTGVVYKVKSGDSLASIAKEYSADQQTMVDYPFNYIDDTLSLKVGQTLMIPGGVKPAPVTYPSVPYTNNPIYYAAGSGYFSFPVPGGGISQYPSWWHPAVDIAAPYGTGVYSVREGKVASISYQGYGFGNYILIDHGDGYTAAYAHLSAIGVSAGQSVSRGQLIGAVGCSGRCTGPHLHLEVRRGGYAINPLSLF